MRGFQASLVVSYIEKQSTCLSQNNQSLTLSLLSVKYCLPHRGSSPSAALLTNYTRAADKSGATLTVDAAYVDAHWRELIDRYHPAVLWNDITSPEATDEVALFTDYYRTVPDGVVNDRWSPSAELLHRDFFGSAREQVEERLFGVVTHKVLKLVRLHGI